MKITIDKEGFVQSAVSDYPKAPPKEDLHRCMGPWHRKAGKGTLLPLSEFEPATRGPNKGKPKTTCKRCDHKNNYQARAERVVAREHMMERLKTEVVETRNNGTVQRPAYKWKVTIVKQVEIIVEASDYLDAGVNAGEGEVVKIERVYS